MARATTKKLDAKANLCFEAKHWLAADNRRSSMEAVEYMHVVSCY